MATLQTSKPKTRFSWNFFGSAKKTCTPEIDILEEEKMIPTLGRWLRRMKKVRRAPPSPYGTLLTMCI
jgi:hypothetical protein